MGSAGCDARATRAHRRIGAVQRGRRLPLALRAGRPAQKRRASGGGGPIRTRREARSGLGGRLDPRIVLEELLVELDEALPLIGRLVFREDRLDRAHGLAGAAVDALVGVDEELVLAFVDAIDRAYLDAGLVLDVDARLGDHMRHWGLPISLVGLVRPRLFNSMTPDCQVFRVLKTRRELTAREVAGRAHRAASRRRD